MPLITHTLAVITPLPDPPFFQLWILERPLPGAILLAIVGLILAATLARRAQARLGAWIGAALLAAGIALYITGALITTERERIIRFTHDLLATVETGDVRRAAEILDDDFALAISGARLSQIDRDVVLSVIENLSAQMELRSVTILETQAVVSSAVAARSQFRIRVIPRAGPPSVTWWRLDWRRAPSGEWRLDTIDWRSWNGRRPGVDRAADVMRFAR